MTSKDKPHYNDRANEFFASHGCHGLVQVRLRAHPPPPDISPCFTPRLCRRTRSCRRFLLVYSRGCRDA